MKKNEGDVMAKSKLAPCHPLIILYSQFSIPYSSFIHHSSDCLPQVARPLGAGAEHGEFQFADEAAE